MLSKAAVDVSTRLHTGEIDPAGHAPGMGYGLTWTIVKDPIATLDLRSKGTYGHGGAFGTQGWVDKAKDMIGVFMIQRSSGGSDKEVEVMRQIAAGAIQ